MLGDIWNIVNYTLANGMLPTDPQGIYMVSVRCFSTTEANRIKLVLLGRQNSSCNRVEEWTGTQTSQTLDGMDPTRA
jgi:hypothetical protein